VLQDGQQFQLPIDSMASSMKDTLTSPWVSCYKPNAAAKLRLFCFPYAGSGALIYRTWANTLPMSIEVFPVELPGHGRRIGEAAFSDLMSLVKAIAPALTPFFDKPFAFFGHSMGAMISFELAHELRENHGMGPVHIFISGRCAPHISDADRIIYDLPEDRFVEELYRLNGTPREVFEHSELMQLMVPLLRADFEVCQTYQYSPKPPLSCSISAFGGLGDNEVPLEHLEAWREYTTRPFSMKMFVGDHFFLRTAESLLLHRISQELQQLVRAL